MYGVTWNEASVSDAHKTPYDEYGRTIGRTPPGYFWFLMAWDWEIEAGEDRLKHRFDDEKSLYVLSAKSPYFLVENNYDLGYDRWQFRYRFDLPKVSTQESKGGKLMCVAIMDKYRRILIQKD